MPVKSRIRPEEQRWRSASGGGAYSGLNWFNSARVVESRKPLILSPSLIQRRWVTQSSAREHCIFSGVVFIGAEDGVGGLSHGTEDLADGDICGFLGETVAAPGAADAGDDPVLAEVDKSCSRKLREIS